MIEYYKCPKCKTLNKIIINENNRYEQRTCQSCNQVLTPNNISPFLYITEMFYCWEMREAEDFHVRENAFTVGALMVIDLLVLAPTTLLCSLILFNLL